MARELVYDYDTRMLRFVRLPLIQVHFISPFMLGHSRERILATDKACLFVHLVSVWPQKSEPNPRELGSMLLSLVFTQ